MFHRGIGFSVRGLGQARWLNLPKCVVGLRKVLGEVTGERADAVAVAKREIEKHRPE